MKRNVFLHTLAVLLVFTGCSREPEFETVNYAPPPVEDPKQKIEVPEAQAGAPPGDAPTISHGSALPSKGTVEVSGRFKPKEAGKVMAVMVRFYGRSGEERVIHADGVVMPQEDKDGYWRYSGRISTPEDPGEYELEVTHFGDLVATGTVKVE